MCNEFLFFGSNVHSTQSRSLSKSTLYLHKVFIYSPLRSLFHVKNETNTAMVEWDARQKQILSQIKLFSIVIFLWCHPTPILPAELSHTPRRCYVGLLTLLLLRWKFSLFSEREKKADTALYQTAAGRCWWASVQFFFRVRGRKFLESCATIATSRTTTLFRWRR